MRMLRRIYGVCLSIITLVVGVAFIVQVWSIFLSDAETPYTVASISVHFSQIAVLVWLWFAVVLCGAAFPKTEEKAAAHTDVKKTLSRLKGRLPAGAEMKEVNKESLYRIALRCVALALCILSTIMGLVILLDQTYTPRFETEFFTGHGAVADRLVRFVPWLFAALIVCVVVAIVEAVSVKRELDLVKRMIADNAKKGIRSVSIQEKKLTIYQRICNKLPFLFSPKFTMYVRIGLCVVGVVLFIVGIVNGGMTDVFEKAKNICTQCIGLG